MSNCLSCKLEGTNLGQAQGDRAIKSIDKFVFKRKTNQDGSIPSIPLTGAAGSFDAAFWAAYFQANPNANRYFPTGNIDDFDQVPQDHEWMETANAIQYKIRDGHIEFEFNVFGSPNGASISAFKRYKSMLECGDLVFYMIDDCGHLVGSYDSQNVAMKGIPMNSVQVLMMPTKNSGEVAHINVKFRVSHTFAWESLGVFLPDVAAGDFDLSEVAPIVPLNLSGIAATDASADVDVVVFQEATQISSGNGQAGIPMVGLIPANFVVTRNGAPVVVSSVTENADGDYTITLATANTTGDVLTVQVVAQGFESSVSTITV